MSSITTFFFSRIVGNKVYSPDGEVLGKIKDLIAQQSADRPKVIAAWLLVAINWAWACKAVLHSLRIRRCCCNSIRAKVSSSTSTMAAVKPHCSLRRMVWGRSARGRN